MGRSGYGVFSTLDDGYSDRRSLLSTVFIVDTCGVQSTNQVLTKMKCKEIDPGHVVTTIHNGIGMPQYYPPSYHVCFYIAGELVTTQVSKELFYQAEVGDALDVAYGFGRLSREIQVDTVRVVHP